MPSPAPLRGDLLISICTRNKRIIAEVATRIKLTVVVTTGAANCFQPARAERRSRDGDVTRGEGFTQLTVTGRDDRTKDEAADSHN